MKKVLLLILGLSVLLPSLDGALANDPQAEELKYHVELQESINGVDQITGNNGTELVGNYITILYKYGASIIGIAAVLIIVVSGIQIIIGGANPEGVNQAKTRILQAILSLVLLFLSAAILKTINPGFFAPETVQQQSSG